MDYRVATLSTGYITAKEITSESFPNMPKLTNRAIRTDKPYSVFIVAKNNCLEIYH